MKLKLCFIALASIISCRNDIPEETKTLNDSSINYNIKSKMLQFSGRFSDVKEFVKSSERERETSFLKFYNEGFRPIDYFDSDKVMTELSKNISTNEKNKISAKILNDDNEEYSEIINNENFREILNEKHQVQVNDSVYQYTKNGLFISHIRDLNKLESYITNNTDINIPEGYSMVTTNIKAYKPLRSQFAGYSIEMDNGFSGKSTNTSIGNSFGATNKNIPNLQFCNPRRPIVDRIYGKVYTCEYKFNRKRKLNSTFAAEDYVLVFDVYAQSKFKQKTWLGWFSSRDAQKLVLNIKEASISLKRKDHTFSTTGRDVTNNYNQFLNIFKTNTNKNTSAVTSEMYKVDNNTVNKKEYYLGRDFVDYSDGNLYVSFFNQWLNGVRFNIAETFGPNVKKVVFVTIFNKEQAVLSNTDLYNEAIKALKKTSNFQEPQTPTAVAIQVVEEKDNKLRSQLATTIVFNEYLESSGNAILRKNFNIKKEFSMDSFSVNYSGDLNTLGNNENIATTVLNALKFIFTAKSNKIDKLNISVESAALYNGVWGGSKFTIIKN